MIKISFKETDIVDYVERFSYAHKRQECRVSCLREHKIFEACKCIIIKNL